MNEQRPVSPLHPDIDSTGYLYETGQDRDPWMRIVMEASEIRRAMYEASGALEALGQERLWKMLNRMIQRQAWMIDDVGVALGRLSPRKKPDGE